LQELIMESMNISLPEPLKAFVDSQISTGRYSSASEYVRELIRGDEKRKAEEQLESLLLAGLKGEEAVMSRADWQQIRQEAMAQVRAKRRTVKPSTAQSIGGRSSA
jgi:antitoxin ParD1/3/4